MSAAEVRRVGIPSNPVFREVNTTRARYVISYGGAGSGKSVNCARKQIADLSNPRNEGMHLLVIRKDNESHRTSTRAELINAINAIFGDHARDVWQWSDSPSGALDLVCKTTGNVVIFRGMLNEMQREKLKSINLPGGKIVRAWVEEATALMPHDFAILDDRLRGELPPGMTYQIFLTFNPVSATHWIKRRFFDVENPDVCICHSTYRDNRFIDDAYRRKMESDPDAEHKRIYAEGLWGEKGGLILTNHRVEAVPLDLDAYDALAMGHDFGFNHADALLLLGWKDGEVYILREHYARGMTNPEIIEAVGRDPLFTEAKRRKVWMICDSAEPDRIKEWGRAGWRARPVDKGKGNATGAAIDWLKARRIHVGSSCENTAAEIGEWAWQLDRVTGLYTDQPVPANDDAMAALRYGTEPFRLAAARQGRPRMKV